MLNGILLEIRRRCLSRLKDKSNVRLDMELGWFSENGGAQALHLMSDYVRHLKSLGIYVGMGKGRECCSLVCYGLGITNLNPEEWNLPFELFCREFSKDYSVYITTSSGGIKEMSYLRKLSDYPDGVMVFDGDGCAQIQFLEDFTRCCLFVVEELPDLDLLKEFQSSRTDDITGIRPDGSLIASIEEKGFAGLSHMARERMHTFLLDFRPKDLNDMIVMNAVFPYSMLALRGHIMAIRIVGNPLRENKPDVRAVLEESYGTLLYKEQKVVLDRYCLKDYCSVLYDSLASKATCVVDVLQALQITAFREQRPELYDGAVKRLMG